MSSSFAICYDRHGPPFEVLHKKKLPLAPLKPGEVRLKMLMTSVNPSDLGMISGTYGRLKTVFPAVAGREGIGEVVELGPDVQDIQEGDWVAIPDAVGTWQTHPTALAAGLFKVPKDISLEQLTLGLINPPTAWRLLHDFVDLEPGSWVIQNAGNSAVGQCVVSLCKHLGLKSISTVRDLAFKPMLDECGADVVVLANSDLHKNIAEITGGEPVHLALNSVGGESAIHLVRALSQGGMHVTFGAMTGDLVRFPTRSLIFDDIKLCGFWLDHWIRTHSREEVQFMYDKVFTFMKTDVLKVAIESVYPLEDALAVLAKMAAQRGKRFGKILFRC
ncbi:MAG TPA: alcohol dehydrogenase [Opitutae bacterium]|nr:alcohol dehydrogenase [Opitutae bacterium]